METLVKLFYGNGPLMSVIITFIGTIIYTVVLKKQLKIPFIFGAVIAFFIAIFIPITITTPLYFIIWLSNKIFSAVRKPSKSKDKRDKSTSESSFTFETGREKIILQNPYRGIYIQGGAGSGKSVSLIYPIIRQAISKGFSGILYDFKNPELSSYAMQLFSENSTNITPYFIDFKNAKNSVRINPLNPMLMHKTAYAHEYAQTLMYNLSPGNIKNESYFMLDAKSVLTGIIWYLKKEYPQYCTLPHIISLILYSDITPLLDRIFENREAAGYVASLRQAMKNDASKQVAGVISTLQANLSKLNTPDIFWILSGEDIDLDINATNNPKFLCVGNESTLAETYAPVISLIISVAMKQMNQSNKHKSIILLDEAPTLYIGNFEQIPATARSNKVVTVYGAQDFSQLVDRYGKDKAEVILSNLGNQFYGRTTNKNTAQMITQMFGKGDKGFKTFSENKGNSSGGFFSSQYSSNSGRSISESIQERDRVKITDITNMQPGEFYGFIAEGNKTEVLKSKIEIDHKSSEAHYKFENKATDTMIEKNYNKIITESMSLFESPVTEEKGTDLIQF